MPFAKWNLEPVYVSRTPPWHTHQGGPKHPTVVNGGPPGNKSTKTNPGSTNATTSVSLPPFVLPLPGSGNNNNNKKQSSSSPSPESSPASTNHTSTTGASSTNDAQITNGIAKPPPTDSLTSPISPSVPLVNKSHHPTLVQFDETAETSVLIKIQCRTMVSVIRQMASLLGASDQLFGEITEECRRLLDRSVQLRSRVVKLSGNIDRANLSIRQNRKWPFLFSLQTFVFDIFTEIYPWIILEKGEIFSLILHKRLKS